MSQHVCQSCAMPMNTEDFGTNKDGSANTEYCKYCYQDGEFTSNESLEEMINACAKYMTQGDSGFTEEEAKKYLWETMPMLNRWKGN